MQYRTGGGVRWFVIAGLSLAGCSIARAAPPPAPAHTIAIKDFMFSPVSVKIKAGTQVTWTNKDEEPHTVSSNEGTFRSFALDTNDSFSYKFDKPGTYKYTCTIHPRMTGTIVVDP
jgi:plastocyanin